MIEPQPIAPRELIGSATYQMNLVLWMATANNQMRVPPVLAKAGFTILSVERALPLSEAIGAKLHAARVEHVTSPEPDFILHGKKSYVILECKRTMFGSESSTAAQCRSLLVLVPRQLEQSLGDKQPGAVSDVHLVYLARCDGNGDEEIGGLMTIREEISSKKIKVVPAGLLALTATDNAVNLHAVKRGIVPPPLRSELATAVKLHEIVPGVDPRMLYVIPWVPHAEETTLKDEYHRIVLAERVKIAAAQIVDRTRTPHDVFITADDIIAGLLGDAAKLWRKKQAFRQFRQEVSTILTRQLAKIKPDGPAVIKQGNAEWAVSIQNTRDKDAVVAALMSPGAHIRVGEAVQLPLESPSKS